jgi:hypothetical protein
MPSVLQIAQNLENRYISGAPKANKEKIKRVIQIYKENKNVTRNIAEKVVMSLYLPSAFGQVGKRGKPYKADEMYDEFVSRYKDASGYVQRLTARSGGIKRKYQVRVVLFTQARKQDPDKEPFQQDEVVDRIIQKRARKYYRAKHQGLLQYWTGYLTVKAYSDRVITQEKGKLTTRGTNEFKQLYRICMTDAHFKERELKAPGYLGGIYVLEWTAIGAPAEQEAPAADP